MLQSEIQLGSSWIMRRALTTSGLSLTVRLMRFGSRIWTRCWMTTWRCARIWAACQSKSLKRPWAHGSWRDWELSKNPAVWSIHVCFSGVTFRESWLFWAISILGNQQPYWRPSQWRAHQIELDHVSWQLSIFTPNLEHKANHFMRVPWYMLGCWNQLNMTCEPLDVFFLMAVKDKVPCFIHSFCWVKHVKAGFLQMKSTLNYNFSWFSKGF